MARSRKRTTEEQFYKIKKLRKMGMPAEDIAEFMNVGTSRIYCTDHFERYEDFERDGGKVYESWRKERRTSHGKKQTKVERVNEGDRDDVIIQLLTQITEQLKIICKELT